MIARSRSATSCCFRTSNGSRPLWRKSTNWRDSTRTRPVRSTPSWLSSPPSDAERDILANIKQTERETLPLIRQISAAKQAGDPSEAHRLLTEAARPKFVAWLTQINQFIDYQEEQNSVVTRRARDIAAEFEAEMLALCGLAVLVGMGVTWWTQASIKPLRVLTERMLRPLPGRPRGRDRGGQVEGRGRRHHPRGPCLPRQRPGGARSAGESGDARPRGGGAADRVHAQAGRPVRGSGQGHCRSRQQRGREGEPVRRGVARDRAGQRGAGGTGRRGHRRRLGERAGRRDVRRRTDGLDRRDRAGGSARARRRPRTRSARPSAPTPSSTAWRRSRLK